VMWEFRTTAESRAGSMGMALSTCFLPHFPRTLQKRCQAFCALDCGNWQAILSHENEATRWKRVVWGEGSAGGD
jgi:hypothetical protein